MRFTWTIAAAWLPLALSGCANFKGMPSLEMKLPEIFTPADIPFFDVPTTSKEKPHD